MLIRNVRIENAESASDIRVEKGIIREISAHLEALEGEEIIEGQGGLVLPPFVDCHVHLDTCLSLDATGPNLSGTLFEGIRVWSEYRKKLDKEEVKERALRTLGMYRKKGVQYIRSHVDISNDLTALEALLELKEQVRDEVEIQLVAFPQDGVMTSEKVRGNLEEAVRMGADVVGGIPHFELTREHGEKSIQYIMEIAQKYDRLVDLHCDEIDDEQSRFLEVLAAKAYETGMGSRVSASHTTAMHSYNNAYCNKLFRVLSMSGINIIANPLVNVNLQGRFDTYPKRRGITRVKELSENGINVSMGHDDIYDPFYPLGNGDMTQVLLMGLHLCHMMGYQELNDSYRIITYNGAKTLNFEEEQYGLAVGKPANFNLFKGRSFFEVLREREGIQYSVRKGKIIHRKE
ncbi:MAG: cytosine deaminase [Lachnospiraceae bacterium]|nr:cytosine deaminase [Lachnospiraceae bacterium]